MKFSKLFLTSVLAIGFAAPAMAADVDIDENGNFVDFGTSGDSCYENGVSGVGCTAREFDPVFDVGQWYASFQCPDKTEVLNLLGNPTNSGPWTSTNGANLWCKNAGFTQDVNNGGTAGNGYNAGSAAADFNFMNGTWYSLLPYAVGGYVCPEPDAQHHPGVHLCDYTGNLDEAFEYANLYSYKQGNGGDVGTYETGDIPGVDTCGDCGYTVKNWSCSIYDTVTGEVLDRIDIGAASNSVTGIVKKSDLQDPNTECTGQTSEQGDYCLWEGTKADLANSTYSTYSMVCVPGHYGFNMSNVTFYDTDGTTVFEDQEYCYGATTITPPASHPTINGRTFKGWKVRTEMCPRS